MSSRGRILGSGGPLMPAAVVEVTRLADDGMVFTWDASGPLSERSAFVGERVEFAYLAVDEDPVTLYIKKSRPGVTPIVWEVGARAPGFTMAEVSAAEAAARNSAYDAEAKRYAAELLAGNASSAAALAGNEAKKSTTSAGDAAASAVEARSIVSLIGRQVFDFSYDSDAVPTDDWSN